MVALSGSHQGLFQATLLLRQGVLLRCAPDGQAEPDFVHEVREVVNQIQRAVRDGTHQVSKEVTKRVDGPSCADDESHEIVRALHSWGKVLARNAACLTSKDLVQNESPAAHADSEAHPWVDDESLTHVTEQKHEHSANEQTEEHAGTKIRLDSLEDQVKL